MENGDFERGYYCAVATLLREEGVATTQVESIFSQGGDPDKADQIDKDLFREHGLLPPLPRNITNG
jgi:spermidine synthase